MSRVQREKLKWRISRVNVINFFDDKRKKISKALDGDMKNTSFDLWCWFHKVLLIINQYLTKTKQQAYARWPHGEKTKTSHE